MKKRRLATGALSIALALTMVSTTAFAASVEFTDVPSSHWAHTSVIEMAEKGVVAGVGNNLFAPDTTVSYAQFATMIVRSFYDDQLVNGGDKWYSSFMTTAEKTGILEGTKVLGNDSLVEAGINRYEMALVMYNVLQDQLGEIAIDFDTTAIADWASIPDNYKDAVSLCYHYGTLSGTDGKGTFSGTTMMTRAQAAVVMDRLLEVCSGGTPSTPEVPETPGEIPADAKPITQLTQLTSKKGLEAYGNGFHTDAGSITYGYATFGTATKGYSVLTLTVRAGDKDVSVYSNVGLIGQNPYEPGEHRGTEIIKAGETRTIEFDVSGSQSCGLSFEDAESEFDGQFAECWITDIYLY